MNTPALTRSNSSRRSARAPAERVESNAAASFRAQARFDGIGGADPREERDDRIRLDPAACICSTP
jgi:hypothetical protein